MLRLQDRKSGHADDGSRVRGNSYDDEPEASTRCRCGRVGGVLAVVLTLLSAAGLLGSAWLMRQKSDLVRDYRAATCSLLEVSHSGWVMCQYCYTGYTTSIRDGKPRTVSRLRCKSSTFPCVKLSVLYQPEDGGATYSGVILDQSSRHAHLKQCSYSSSCAATSAENEREVRAFVDRWRTLPTSPCLYDPMQPDVVLDDSFLEYNLAVQGIIWASLFLTGCVAFIVGHWIRNYLYLRRRRINLYNRNGMGGASMDAEKLCGASFNVGDDGRSSSCSCSCTSSCSCSSSTSSRYHQKTENVVGPWTMNNDSMTAMHKTTIL